MSFSPQCLFQADYGIIKLADTTAVAASSVELCGAFCVWLTKDVRETLWLSGRWMSATWDTEELIARKDDIVQKDLLKARIALS